MQNGSRLNGELWFYFLFLLAILKKSTVPFIHSCQLLSMTFAKCIAFAQIPFVLKDIFKCTCVDDFAIVNCLADKIEPSHFIKRMANPHGFIYPTAK